MSDEEPKEAYPGQNRSRAEALCAMDCLMHHLNDEEDIEGWLMNGVPDGGPWGVLDGTDPKERLDYYMPFVDDFEEHAKLFARIVRRVCFKTTYKKGGFC
jgi:hypothetical protein